MYQNYNINGFLIHEKACKIKVFRIIEHTIKHTLKNVLKHTMWITKSDSEKNS